MNKKKAMELLIEYLQRYGEKSFCFHIQFIKELKAIFQKEAVGHEDEVFRIMIKQFDYVNTMGIQVNEADHNEILKHTNSKKAYYSLHIQNKTVNVRMLITFTANNIPVFLAAFNEKKGKKSSDYTQWIPVIKERYNQIGDEENE